MMKRLYICFLLLAMVSTAVIAQDVQQKDDAKKEAKATKPKKEKKAKEPKAKKEKAKKSSSKAAAKTTASKTSKTNKKLKKDTPEYEAQMRASKIAMDSVLKYNRETGDMLMKFADIQCEKFGNDPVFMDSVAESFYTIYNNEIFGERRYSALKKMYPEYTEAYLTEARLFHSMAWYEDAEGWHFKTDLLKKAKEKIDSAKIVMPNDPEPYMVWFRLQAKRMPTDADKEIDTLKLVIPSYPADLEAAKTYDYMATGEYRALLQNAFDHYCAVDMNTMKNTDLYNFAFLCTRANIKEFWERGDSVVKFCSKKYPEYHNINRMGLWISGKLRKWDDAIEFGETFFEKCDTIQKTYIDYQWLALAYFTTKKYDQAIEWYEKMIEMPNIPKSDNVEALNNIVGCYRFLKKNDDALLAFKKLEEYKKSIDKPMEASDYQNLIETYYNIMADTTYSKEEHIRACEVYDSLCQISAKASPNYTGLLYSWAINIGAKSYVAFDNPDLGWKHPKIYEVASRAIEADKAYQKTIDEIPDNDVYYLMEAYHWLLEYYIAWGKEKYQEMFECTEAMINMPLEFDLPTLRSEFKVNYIKWMNGAETVNGSLRRQGYGKKK